MNFRGSLEVLQSEIFNFNGRGDIALDVYVIDYVALERK